MSWLWALRCWIRGGHSIVLREPRRAADIPWHYWCPTCDQVWLYPQAAPLTEAEMAARDRKLQAGPFPR